MVKDVTAPGSLDSREMANGIYNIEGWGIGYFDIDDQGFMRVSPSQDPEQTIRIIDIVQEAYEEGLRPPLQIRFQDLLRHRVVSLNQAFAAAKDSFGFKGKYSGVFPLKVNQLREVVEEIIDAGESFNFGLEAGSKPELLAALSMHTNYDSLIVCNGYKDEYFIRHALHGTRLGKKVVLVAEKMGEIRKIIEMASAMEVEPLIGMRIRLNAKASGQWGASGGSSAKFGLSTAEILEAVNLLQESGFESSFKLLHFHIGSQIPEIRDINRAVREGARYYAKLVQYGCKVEYIDVGGGLGVDYDGSASVFSSSINYSLQEYANDIVSSIVDVCGEEKVPHPNIISESGRALVAHHSMIVVDVFGTIEKAGVAPPKVTSKSHKLVRRMQDISRRLSPDTLTECYHDLLSIHERTQSMFLLGLMDLESKGAVETLFWKIAAEIVGQYEKEPFIPEEIAELKTTLAEQYICNFSVFQSLPDYWALGQLFPIVPIHRLDEEPTHEATIADITCDSDGKVNKFIDLKDVKETLPLHSLTDEPYFIGLFMTGAYQDVMGDLHNLFGRANEVHVYLDPDEEQGWYIEEKVRGSSILEVLEMNQYHRSQLVKDMKRQVDKAIKADVIKPSAGIKLLNAYEKALKDYTYVSPLKKA
ncbi:MAG TPA: biosynthetic arginine decarboxylase [Desulfobacteraceae bacterium]|nr:biosynthetic arginine decarboxylase [Desulfobacteraceae bacterium]